MNGTQFGRKGRRQIGIQWKMYAILILFVAMVVGVLWFFQVRMLHYFYQSRKLNELEICAVTVSANLENSRDLLQKTEQCASDYYTDIWVYRIDGNQANPIAHARGLMDTDIPYLESKMERLYNLAMQNEGFYIAMVPLNEFYNSMSFEILDDNMGEPESYPMIAGYTERLSAVYVGIYHQGAYRYLVVQSTELSPMSAMMNTLQDQTLWSGLILSLFALLMAYMMSRLITNPFIKMNDAAKQLAEGKYEVNFSGSGYREINELADTLNYASKELAKTDRLQKELISNISHDLRTPLTMIKGYSEVIRDIPGENTPENIQIIIDETSRLSELVNDMLDISRIQAGTRTPEFQVFSLTDTVRDTLHRYERLCMQDGYRIEFSCDCDVEVMADRGMILQVIYNLINNAVNYTGEDKYVLVKQSIEGDNVRISISDTGEGISEEQIPMIWDRYYRADKMHKRATVGTGLGLSIVKGILELHQASYGVHSKIGEGSVFWFELKAFRDMNY
ncbi:MAG: HAMP domain-containing histidine kinase [Clostridia bacterium]|nr:HAMP domain-containing histidine kinase [Clostridia bacterium]